MVQVLKVVKNILRNTVILVLMALVVFSTLINYPLIKYLWVVSTWVRVDLFGLFLMLFLMVNMERLVELLLMVLKK